MRIAQFTLGRPRPDSANGVDKTVFYLSKALAESGHDVALFSVTKKKAYPIPGVDVRAYRPRLVPLLVPDTLVGDLSEWKPDIVHLHSVYTPVNTALARWLYKQRIPFVVRPAGGLGRQNEKKKPVVKTVYKRLFELDMLNRSLFVHSVGDTRDIEAYGTDAPIVVTPKGVDSSLRPDHSKSELLQRFPQTSGKLVFAFLGRVAPHHKGLDLLLEGFAESHLDDAVLLLIGPDHRGGEDELRSLASTLGIASQVIFVGPAFGQDKVDLLSGADVFVHPSRWEGGIPYSVIEAAAMGKPCLLTSGADPDGLLARYGGSIEVGLSAAAVARGLRRFAALSAEERRSMGEGCRRMVDERFGWSRMARAFSESVEMHLGRSC